MIRVHDGGVRTTVQDAGRFGLYHLGMPPSGALDDYSFRAANLLVGNDERAAVLEATFSGPTLEFEQDGVIAVTGADLPLALDGEEQPGWTSLAVKAGQVLSFDFLRAGARAYIAVAGGIDVPVVFGSRSTYALCVIGGLEGRAIREGDVLPVGNGRPAAAGRSVEERLRPPLPKEVELRVNMGLCDYRLSEEGRRSFLESEWTVTPRPTASAIATAVVSSRSWSASSPSARAATRRTWSISGTPSARSRCRAAWSRSACSTTPSPVAATSRSAR